MQTGSARQQVRRVLLLTLVLNLVVAIGKIVVGAASGALAISADGLHSLIDGASNVIALFASRVAGKPPDAEHPYGHRRFETMAALLLGALLLLTAWEIITGAVERLQTGSRPDVSPLTLGVLGITLVVNLFVSRYERREGRRLNSELLLADAANTGADVFVTISVLISTAVVALTGWSWLDPLAALVIVVLIGRAGWKVMRETGGVLVDRAPFDAASLASLVAQVPSVAEVVRVRSRGPADAAQIGVDVRVAPFTTADRAAAIASAITETLRQRLDGVSEVEVHFAPDYAREPDYALAARARADALGLATHEVRVSAGPEGKVLEMHVEVPPGESLGEAHERVSELEIEVRESLPDVAEVITHIEPTLSATTSNGGDARAGDIRGEAIDLLSRYYPGEDWHDVQATRLDGGYGLSMHLTLPASTTVEEAHDKAEAAELMLRARMDDVQRVTIHTEPPEPQD